QRAAVRWCQSSAAGCARRGAHAQHRRSVRRRGRQSNQPGTRSGAMNIETNAMSEVLESQVTVPTEISAMRRFYWSVRREFWENRSLYLAPLAVAALFLVSFVISTAHLRKDLRAAAGLDPMRQHQIITEPYDIAAALIMLSVIIVGVFYCMDALYGERRDRSILFWKSLPVSDGTAVLAKACIPMLILPVVAFAVIVVMHFVMLLLSSAVIAANGLSVSAYWSQVWVLRMSLLLLYHLLTVHAL